ncbi:condensation domain-containing protein [Microcoleus sp. BROC3]|uniref:condensation domain-containing protein n=1 Tax=Microcoleus sp. BROC3 TaxID=3055323 RepID=UPI002FCE6B20
MHLSGYALLRIFQKAENKFEFLMSIYHAVTDGWGNLKFLNELYEIYSALKKGEEITVVSAANVYKEFVVLEKEIIGSLDASSFWQLASPETHFPHPPLSQSVFAEFCEPKWSLFIHTSGKLD